MNPATKTRVAALVGPLVLPIAFAKLPPPDDAAKARAAEAAARSAWQAKVDAYQLCNVQDRVVAYVRSHPAKGADVPTQDVRNTAAPATATASAAKPAAAGASAAASAVAPAAPMASAASAAAPAASMPSAASAPAAAASAPNPATARAAQASCIDPGPFAYNPPQQTPLETSGAHSPPGTAIAPPSVPATSSQMQPAKK